MVPWGSAPDTVAVGGRGRGDRHERVAGIDGKRTDEQVVARCVHERGGEVQGVEGGAPRVGEVDAWPAGDGGRGDAGPEPLSPNTAFVEYRQAVFPALLMIGKTKPECPYW